MGEKQHWESSIWVKTWSFREGSAFSGKVCVLPLKQHADVCEHDGFGPLPVRSEETWGYCVWIQLWCWLLRLLIMGLGSSWQPNLGENALGALRTGRRQGLWCRESQRLNRAAQGKVWGKGLERSDISLSWFFSFFFPCYILENFFFLYSSSLKLSSVVSNLPFTLIQWGLNFTYIFYFEMSPLVLFWIHDNFPPTGTEKLLAVIFRDSLLKAWHVSGRIARGLKLGDCWVTM